MYLKCSEVQHFTWTLWILQCIAASILRSPALPLKYTTVYMQCTLHKNIPRITKSDQCISSAPYFMWSTVHEVQYTSREAQCTLSEAQCTSWEANSSSAVQCVLRCTGNALHFDLGLLYRWLPDIPAGETNFSCHSPKDTSYVWGKKQRNLQLRDDLACNSANKPSFQNLTQWSFISWIAGQIVQKLQIWLFFASFIASILKVKKLSKKKKKKIGAL